MEYTQYSNKLYDVYTVYLPLKLFITETSGFSGKDLDN